LVFSAFLNEHAEILRSLLELYYPRTPKVKVIDLTYGKGHLWNIITDDPTLRRKYRVTACDAKPANRKVIKRNLLTDDYSNLGRHNAALFDPPYLINRVSFDYAKVGRNSWSADPNRKRYTENQSLEEFNHRVECLSEKAHTFLKPNGLLFVKILDPRRDGTLIPHHINVTRILSNRFELVDLAVYVRMGATTWKIRGHIQNLHGYWLVFKLKEAQENSCFPTDPGEV